MMKLKHSSEYYHTSFFKWRQRIGFGISDYACNLAYLLTNTYLLFYYTNCAGIEAGAAGFMFLVTKFIDAITDYLVGTWIDRTDTKMGRYRPWMLFGAPVLAIGMVLLFSVPVSWGGSQKLIWAYASYIIFSFGYTLVNIPLVPVVTSLSADPVERTKIVTTKQMLASLGALTSSVFVLPMVNFFSGGEGSTGSALALGYRITNMILGAVVVILMIICVLNIEEINPPTVAPDKEKSSIFKDMKIIFKNKYYIMIILYVFFYFWGYLGMMAAIQYYFTYVLGNPTAMSAAMSIMTIVPIPVMALAAFINSKGIAKARLMIFGSFIELAAFLVMIFCPSVTVTMIAVIVSSIGSGFRGSIMFATFPDIFDYTEYDAGKSLAGTQTAVIGFASKLSSALASATVSALLVWGAYDSAVLDKILTSGGSVHDIALSHPSTVMSIKLAFAGVSVITTILTILVMIPYDLDKKYATIRSELDKRMKKEIG